MAREVPQRVLWQLVDSDYDDATTKTPDDCTAWVSIGQGGDAIQYDAASGNDWTNAPGTYDTPAYRVDHWGYIHFRGAVQKTDSTSQMFGSPIFTMPAGLRPGVKVYAFPVMKLAGSVWGGGNLSVWGVTFPGGLRYAGPHATIETLSLESITYLIEN